MSLYNQIKKYTEEGRLVVTEWVGGIYLYNDSCCVRGITARDAYDKLSLSTREWSRSTTMDDETLLGFYNPETGEVETIEEEIKFNPSAIKEREKAFVEGAIEGAAKSLKIGDYKLQEEKVFKVGEVKKGEQMLPKDFVKAQQSVLQDLIDLYGIEAIEKELGIDGVNIIKKSKPTQELVNKSDEMEDEMETKITFNPAKTTSKWFKEFEKETKKGFDPENLTFDGVKIKEGDEVTMGIFNTKYTVKKSLDSLMIDLYENDPMNKGTLIHLSYFNVTSCKTKQLSQLEKYETRLEDMTIAMKIHEWGEDNEDDNKILEEYYQARKTLEEFKSNNQ